MNHYAQLQNFVSLARQARYPLRSVKFGKYLDPFFGLDN